MECVHMSGAGNDFMVIDGRGLNADWSALAKRLCALTGADGFMAADVSRRADLRLHFYNSDGSRGEMCGNGSRCICKFAYDHGMAGADMTVEADAGIVTGHRLSDTRYRIDMNLPTVSQPRAGVWYTELGDPGLPHALMEVQGLTWDMAESLRQTALTYRHHPAFPKGANVNFYTRLDGETVRILTYERGVEDYTLACGTGCCCVTAALWKQGLLPEGRLTLKNRGGDLTVQVQGERGEITSLTLEGQAEVLETLEITL